MGLSPLSPFASDSVVKHLIPLWALWLLVEPGNTCCDMCVSIVSHDHSSTRPVVSALFLQIEVECATANMLSSCRNLSSKCEISMHMYCLPWMGDNGVVGSIIIVLYMILRLWCTELSVRHYAKPPICIRKKLYKILALMLFCQSKKPSIKRYRDISFVCGNEGAI